MPDEIDRLVDQEQMLEAQALENRERLSDEDKALVEAGIMTKDAARELTDQIKATATATYVLVHRAHEYKCWVALGYDSWEKYVITEFDMSKSRSYQLINQAKVVEAIQDVVPDGTNILLTEAQARDVEKALPRITDKLKASTAGQTPEEAAQTVKDVVSDVREEEKAKKESKKRTENDGVSLLDADELDKETKKQERKEPGNKTGGVAPVGNDKMLQSTGDDDDFDDDIDDADFDDFGGIGSSTLAIGYIFACVEGLGDPDEAAATIDDTKKNLDNTKDTISWMKKFQSALEKRMNGSPSSDTEKESEED